MKKDEKLALQYLESLGFENILHEPDGNIPPDFLIDNKVALEVRRLNQNFESGDRNSGLENIQFPLMHKIQNLLSNIKASTFEKSYFILYTFRRPLNLNKIVVELTDLLTQFSEDGNVKIGDYEIHDRFRITIFPASKKHSHLFILGGYSDLDSGGFVVSEMNRNLVICEREKS